MSWVVAGEGRAPDLVLEVPLSSRPGEWTSPPTSKRYARASASPSTSSTTVAEATALRLPPGGPRRPPLRPHRAPGGALPLLRAWPRSRHRRRQAPDLRGIRGALRHRRSHRPPPGDGRRPGGQGRAGRGRDRTTALGDARGHPGCAPCPRRPGLSTTSGPASAPARTPWTSSAGSSGPPPPPGRRTCSTQPLEPDVAGFSLPDEPPSGARKVSDRHVPRCSPGAPRLCCGDGLRRRRPPGRGSCRSGPSAYRRRSRPSNT